VLSLEGGANVLDLTGENVFQLVKTIVLEQGGGRIAFRFHARDRISCSLPERASRFLSASSSTASLPAPHMAVDVDEDGDGVLADGRLYQLVRERDRVPERTLDITFLEPGVEAYAFTFG
jgi:hypothetical protein